jgi:hypothetical protein
MERPISPSSHASGSTAEAEGRASQRWLSVTDYCALYGFSRRRVWRAIKDGTLKAHFHSQRRGYLILDEADVLDGRSPIEGVAFVKVSEVAKLVGVVPRTVLSYIQRGMVRSVREGPGTTSRHYLSISQVRRIIELRAHRKGKFYNAQYRSRKSRQREAVMELVRQKLSTT